MLANGTISFQENPCAKLKTFQTNQITKPTKTTKKATIKRRAITYQKIAKVKDNNNKLHTISDRVKSYDIAMQVPGRWNMFKKVYNNKLLHMKFLDYQAGGEISLLIDFIFPDNKKFSDSELTDLIYLVGSRYIKGSKEQQVQPYKLKVSNGKGIMATFTQSDIVNDYTYASKGFIFKGKWLIQFTLLSNNLQSSSHQLALQSLVKTIKISKN